MTPLFSRPLIRSKLRRASFSCASAAASCARSWRVSSCARTVPARTVTPATATTVPMALKFAGHCSWRTTIVVTASGGGRKDECCAMAVLTWRYFTAPMAVTKTAIPNSIRVIRFFMRASPPISTSESFTESVPARGSFDCYAPLLEQDARRAGELGLRLAIVGQRRGLCDPRVGQVVLARQDEEVGRHPGVEAFLLRHELRLGGGARRPGRFDPLPGRLEREDRVADLRADFLLGGRDPDRGLRDPRPRDREVRLRGSVPDGNGECEADRRIRKAVLADRAVGAPRSAVERRGNDCRLPVQGDGVRVHASGQTAALVGGDEV